MLKRVDDLILLAQVVEAGSFTAASRLTGIPTARISRRISDLEIELGIKLIERTTRSFRITDLGLHLSEHGNAIRSESDKALTLINSRVISPNGPLRVACPVSLAELIISAAAVDFADRHREVELTFDVINGAPDTRTDNYDLMFMPTMGTLKDSGFIAREMLETPYELVASGAWLDAVGRPQCLSDLDGLAGIGWWYAGSRPVWHLSSIDGDISEVPIRPIFRTNNLDVALRAALTGLGMARLPFPLCRDHLLENRLERVIPTVLPEPMHIYVVYPSRRSLTSAGRAFLNVVDRHLDSFLHGRPVEG